MVDEDYKKRIENRIAGFLKRQEPTTHRSNGHPEKDVVKEILQWCELKDWSISVISSSSVYSERENRYLTAQAPAGFPDLCGCTSLGMGAFLEIKAPGKRSTMSDVQMTFLMNKIERGAFAGVFDSVDLLESTYLEWLDCQNKKAFLLRSLPRTILKKEPGCDDNPFDGLGD